jgi:hypothetical protein
MSYSEKDGQVILTMSRDDYDSLLLFLGIATGHAIRNGSNSNACLAFVNRLNSGNPNYTPFSVPEAKP